MTLPTIRRATKKDIPYIIAFNQAMALETENVSLSLPVLTRGVETVFNDDSNGFYIVCEQNQQACACLMITYEWSDWRNGQFWWIQSVFVEKQYRNQGIYKKMYQFIKTLADNDKNICGIRLYVDGLNDSAKIVYNRLGMEQSNYQLFEYSKEKFSEK